MVLTFPFLIVPLGLFLLVLNAAMLWLTGAISDAAELGFHVSSFKAAFIGGLVVSVVSFVLSLMVGSDSKKSK
jgi:putative membrane protein